MAASEAMGRYHTRHRNLPHRLPLQMWTRSKWYWERELAKKFRMTWSASGKRASHTSMQKPSGKEFRMMINSTSGLV